MYFEFMKILFSFIPIIFIKLRQQSVKFSYHILTILTNQCSLDKADKSEEKKIDVDFIEKVLGFCQVFFFSISELFSDLRQIKTLNHMKVSGTYLFMTHSDL
jgi:hypothetical protein